MRICTNKHGLRTDVKHGIGGVPYGAFRCYSAPMPIAPDSTATHLTVTLVLYHSDTERLRSTLNSLLAAVGLLPLAPRVVIALLDQSEDAAYHRQVVELLAAMVPADNIEICLGRGDNRGYGAGHNRAASPHPATFYLVLNPDVDMAVDCLRLGLETLQQHCDIALVAPRAYCPKGSEEFLAKGYPSVVVLALRAFAPHWLRNVFRRRLDAYELRHLNPADPLQAVTLISGCFMLMRRAKFDAVGGFDERYFLYFEDYDLTLRLAKLDRVVRVPAMTITHYGGQAARKGWRHIRLFTIGAGRFFNTWGWHWF